MYKKTISKRLRLPIALLVTIAIVIISYASYITYAANQRTISTLSEISHQNQTIFSLELGRDAKIIENAASYTEKSVLKYGFIKVKFFQLKKWKEETNNAINAKKI